MLVEVRTSNEKENMGQAKGSRVSKDLTKQKNNRNGTKESSIFVAFFFFLSRAFKGATLYICLRDVIQNRAKWIHITILEHKNS